jgi:sugar lactone lactonase YvrE
VAVESQDVCWSGSTADIISRANPDGTDTQNIALNQKDPTGVAVDGQHVYWGTLLVARLGARTSPVP